MTISSSDMEGRADEARLYGSEHYGLEDAITPILVEKATGAREGGDRVDG